MELSTITLSGAPAFLAAVQLELGHRELEHHLILGVAHGLAVQPKSGTRLAIIRDARGIALAALMSPKRPLITATNRERLGAAIDDLVRWMSESDPLPPGFIADVPHAEGLAHAWQRASGGEARLKMRQRLHALRKVVPLPMAAGRLRPASRGDLGLLQAWIAAFNSEALGETMDPELRDAIARRIDREEIFIWEDREPRSMAASARRTPHGVAINSVYTPPELRGHGYATSCVAALSQQLLASGKDFCVLYTDLANTTSNAIYARIGYRAIADSMVYALSGPSRPDP